MLIYTDEDVPDIIGQFLAQRGHQVLRARDHFMLGEDDQVIAAAASRNRAVVVTWNARHFKALAKRRNRKGQLSYPGLSLIAFTCLEPHGRGQLRVLIQEIEAVHEIRVVRGQGRMIADISESVLRFED